MRELNLALVGGILLHYLIPIIYLFSVDFKLQTTGSMMFGYLIPLVLLGASQM